MTDPSSVTTQRTWPFVFLVSWRQLMRSHVLLLVKCDQVSFNCIEQFLQIQPNLNAWATGINSCISGSVELQLYTLVQFHCGLLAVFFFSHFLNIAVAHLHSQWIFRTTFNSCKFYILPSWGHNFPGFFLNIFPNPWYLTAPWNVCTLVSRGLVCYFLGPRSGRFSYITLGNWTIDFFIIQKVISFCIYPS